MPFTFAHPMTVLCFPRNSRYFHFPALVLGAMSPDFVYMLYLKISGHTLFGSEWINLPLCLLFYGIYRWLLAKAVKEHLPNFWASKVPQSTFSNPLIWVIVFFYSAWIGMVSHIALDGITHDGGYFVELFPILKTELIFPVYSWLQYGLGAIGLTLIAFYQRRMAKAYPYNSSRTPKQKKYFWLSVFILMNLIFWVSELFYPMKWSSLNATTVLRAIDSFFVSLTVHALIFKLSNK
ncbi:DUF4184 family protein [Glaesserella sp.]|uniref:DUF4184 family protein n=1 Tax=Glaesserella sp. TaxID=2094731 RepID=UPI0035A1860A